MAPYPSNGGHCIAVQRSLEIEAAGFAAVVGIAAVAMVVDPGAIVVGIVVAVAVGHMLEDY